jgi:EpsI family protein
MEPKSDLRASAAAIYGRLDPSTHPAIGIWLQVGLLLVLYLLFYRPALPGLVRDWYNNSTFSYGFLIPLLFAFLVWSKRPLLKTIPIRPSAWGILLLAGAVIIRLAAEGIGDAFTTRVSMLIALVALVILILGIRQFKMLRYPLAYLFLMIPWPYTFLKPITDSLRLSQAAMLALALNSVGVHVTREAYFLYLPNIILEVADVCSGLASVFALTTVAGIHAYFLSIRPTLKLLLIVSAAPFAIIGNLVRMIVTAILAYFFGSIVFQTTLHTFGGTLTFLLGLALLIALGELLRRKAGGFERQMEAGAMEEVPKTRSKPISNWPMFLLAAGLLVLGSHLAAVLGRQSAVPVKGELQKLSAHLGPYVQSHSEWTSRYQDDEAETSISRIYEGERTIPIELFVGYRGSQWGDHHLRSPRMYSPDDWNYVWERSSRLPGPNGATIDGKWVLIGRGSARRLIFYWYQIWGRSVSGELEYRLHLIRKSLIDRRTDGAVIRIATPVSQNESIEESKERIENFALVLYPELRAILPD